MRKGDTFGQRKLPVRRQRDAYQNSWKLILVAVSCLLWHPSKAESLHTIDDILRVLPRVTIDGVDRIIIEGDLLVSHPEAVVRIRSKMESDKFSRHSSSSSFEPELLVHLDATGKFSIWPRGQRRFTYSIDRRTFPRDDQYNQVAEAMHRATRDWELACMNCGVQFAHMVAFDAAPKHSNVLFIVRQFDSGGRFLAAAFFPDTPPSDRYLNVDPSLFSSTFDHIGVLRHELGHVLGYRHEHIRGVLGCRAEGSNWVPITPYDPHSVMHYFCGGGGTVALQLSPADVIGHRRIYGAP